LYINQSKNVKHQYSSDKNLAARINLHAKHSTNKQGFFPWLFEHYQFSNSGTILELGCGNAMQWKGRTSKLPHGSSLILSDFSHGMLEAAKENLSPIQDNISFMQIDIQDIPFPAGAFDTIIANHMLYYVPDIDSALAQVSRVLKKDGRFYATTISNNGGGIGEYIRDVMKKFGVDASEYAQNIPFNIENGSDILGRHFASVKRYDYVDSLAITETNDLIDWLQSSMFMSGFGEESIRELYEYFENIRVAQGSINIPKETCLFIQQNQ